MIKQAEHICRFCGAFVIIGHGGAFSDGRVVRDAADFSMRFADFQSVYDARANVTCQQFQDG